MSREKAQVVVSSWQRAMRVPRKRIVEVVHHVAAAEGAALKHVDIAVVSGGRIAALNRRYLGRRGATDVLSFNLSDEAHHGGLAAQIVVCGDLAARRGRSLATGCQRELLLYVVHGLLHLLGYDDRTPRQATRMHSREEKLLNDFLGRKKAR